ncbi:MAG TPA: formate/nitrite transporter family protein [Chloroflexota bacterium]|nr:formate/nitrite transporter family protein [Chloroflexota bacterium]
MFEDTIEAVAGAADKKFAALSISLPRYVLMSALAGAYVGLGIALIFAIGAPLAKAGSPLLKVVMGASFGVALTLVIFAGSELFTGNALVLMVGALTGRSSWKQLGSVWLWSYAGNLAGCLALAWLLAQSGALGGDPQKQFIETTAATKMHLEFWPAFARGILANWLVCLAVWCSMRTKSDVAKLVIIFWCLFAFVGAGFEHSIANMTLLALALFQPHGDSITWLGYIQNLVPVTLGNIVGGALFVGGAYWLTSPVKAYLSAPAAQPAPRQPQLAMAEVAG